MPSSAVFLARNLCGVCTSMPAPSPERGSAPTAPRCSRLTRIVNASSTILCDLRPLMSAINPTPQESFSSAGSNRPKPDASIVVLAILPEPRPPWPCASDAVTVALLPRHRPHAGDGRERACAHERVAPGRGIRLGGNLCAALAAALVACSCRPARPRHRRPTRPLPPPEPRRRAMGSPIGTAMLSYTEHGKFQSPIQAPAPHSCALRPRIEKGVEQPPRGARSP